MAKRFCHYKRCIILHKILNLFGEHLIECSFLKQQLNKLTERRAILKGCGCLKRIQK